MDSPVQRRDVLAIAGEVYRSVERHVVEVLTPVSTRGTSVIDFESEPLSEKSVDKRTGTRGGKGPGKRSPVVEARTGTRGGGGPGRRSTVVEARTGTRGGGGPGRRSTVVEA